VSNAAIKGHASRATKSSINLPLSSVRNSITDVSKWSNLKRQFDLLKACSKALPNKFRRLLSDTGGRPITRQVLGEEAGTDKIRGRLEERLLATVCDCSTWEARRRRAPGREKKEEFGLPLGITA